MSHPSHDSGWSLNSLSTLTHLIEYFCTKLFINQASYQSFKSNIISLWSFINQVLCQANYFATLKWSSHRYLYWAVEQHFHNNQLKTYNMAQTWDGPVCEWVCYNLLHWDFISKWSLLSVCYQELTPWLSPLTSDTCKFPVDQPPVIHRQVDFLLRS